MAHKLKQYSLVLINEYRDTHRDNFTQTKRETLKYETISEFMF